MAIAFIQGTASASGGSTVATQPTTYGSNTTSGNLLICCTGWATNTFTGFAVADNIGDSVPWVLNAGLQAQQGSNSPYSIAIAYKVTTATSSTPRTVTVTPGGSPRNFIVNLVHEYSGVDSLDSSAIVSTSSANVSGTTATSGAFTTTHANELIFAFPIFDQGTTSAPGAGYAQRVTVSGQLTEDKIVSSIQTGATATATNTPTGIWAIIVAPFFSAASGPAPVDSTPLVISQARTRASYY